MDFPVADASTYSPPVYVRQPETTSDENITNLLSPTPEDTSQETLSEELAAVSSSQDQFYDMSGDKILLIFNHFKYKKSRHYNCFTHVPNKRHGTFADVKSLEKTFGARGFDVRTYNDQKYKEIMKHLSDLCSMEHGSTSCVAVAVMSHGLGACVCAADQMYPLADITDTLQAAPSLAGKPKLFFIQACRGGHTQPRPPPAFPVGTHCLLLYSTYSDYLSYRNSGGSWMMQALCKVIDTHHATMHLVDMATLVNQEVSKSSCDWGHQMPAPEFNFTKFLML